MRVSALSIGTIALQLVLGNLCMMPLTMAEEGHDMPVMASHEEENHASEEMSCDGEHCFVPALPTQTSLAIDGALAMNLPVTPNIIESTFRNELPAQVSTAPPGQFIPIQTIVLRN